jgi:hypothetical protein
MSEILKWVVSVFIVIFVISFIIFLCLHPTIVLYSAAVIVFVLLVAAVKIVLFETDSNF